MGCLGEDAVLRFLQGADESEAARVHEHLASCADCRAIVGDVAMSIVTSQTDAGAPVDHASMPSLEPRRVGRYEIATTLGVGGMGIVYEAFDPQLHRKVALKLLRSDRGLPDPEVWQARLLREAQAMARLSHPNVMPVYDAGVFGGQVFVVMELVTGKTLRAWAKEQKRTFDEVLALYMQAGRGLAAAHSAGIVHRDFKPENVLLGVDGRVRVTDFGLARTSEHDSSVDTHALAFAGTPAYMAPEQFHGGTIDARTDQFAFCVSLYEAFYRARPFRAASVKELAEVVSAGLSTMPDDPDISPAVAAIVRRGLQADPNARYPSIDALLTELDATTKPLEPTVARRRWLAPVAFGAIVCSGALVWAAWPRHHAASTPVPTQTQVAIVSTETPSADPPGATTPKAISVATRAPMVRPPRSRTSATPPPAHSDALIGDPWKK